jgi:8-amino-7-oxononanoate synthase
MHKEAANVASMTEDDKRLLLKRLLARQQGQATTAAPAEGVIPEEYYRFEQFPGYRLIQEQKESLRALAMNSPYFSSHDGVSDHVTHIEGRDFINYSGYNYLGLSGHPEVSAAAKAAVEHYGTSVSASRIVSGEIPLHAELERALAEIHGTEDALALVSGYATNVSVIGHLFGPNDLLLHDSLIHNSVVTGCQLSGARRMSFPHNDWEALDKLLAENRRHHQKVLVVIEGVYSMDGDIPDLPRFIEVKKRHQSLLMVDEAHAAGVIGPRGFGSHDHFGLDAAEVDIWMGTLSKAFASCGGYICGSKALIDNLKYNAPGAVLFSVGISPANAGAALAAARIIQREPERAERLRARSRLFLETAKAQGLDTGPAEGTGVVPIILGNSMLCLKLGQRLRDQGINVHPILYPAVPEAASRLRFFITSGLTEGEVIYTVSALATALAELQASL